MTDNELRPKTPTKKRKLKARIITDREEVKKGHAEQSKAKPNLWWFVTRFSPVWILLIIILLIEPTLPFRAFAAVVQAIVPEREEAYTPDVSTTAADLTAVADLPAPEWNLTISPIFTDEVQYWQQGISEWSLAYRIEPNIIATLMQIESCGNPEALSPADAMGLFQVLDLHFEPDEDPFDPDINAKRGLLFYGELLAQTNLDEGLSFAAYNAGPRVITQSPTDWPRQTQDYQFWASGILEEANSNVAQSPTLNEWLAAGGSSLCQQAAEELGLATD